MKIKVKRLQVAQMLQALIGITAKQEAIKVGKEEKLVRANWPVWFQYFLTRNQDILMSIVHSMNKEGSKRTAAYDSAREEINKRYARQDAGVPILKDGHYDIPPEDMKAYTKEQQELQIKYKSVFEDFKKFDQEEIEIDVHTLNMSKMENLELPSGSFEVIQSLVNLEA